MGFFEFFSALDSIGFVFGSPLGNFGVGFREGTLKFSFRFLFFFVLFTEKIVIMTASLYSMGKGSFSFAFFVKSTFQFFIRLSCRVFSSGELSNKLFFLFNG